MDDNQKEFNEALKAFTESLHSSNTALTDSEKEAKKFTSDLKSEFDKLGITLKSNNDLEDTRAAKTKRRLEVEEEVNKKLIESGKVRNREEAESYKKTLRAQEATAARTDAAYRASSDAVDGFNNKIKDFAKEGGLLALSSAFNYLQASVVGTYKGMLASQDALLDGQRGQTVQTIAVVTQLKEQANALSDFGGSLSSIGGGLAQFGLQLALVNLPLAALTLAVAGLLKLFGMAAKVEAEREKRNADMELKRAQLNDTLYANFQKLSASSLTGAKGMTGLYEDLHKFGLSIKDFDKFGKVLQENTKNLVLFGAGTVDGVKQFTETASSLVKSGLGKTLEAMGISVEEQMAHTAQFMAQQARFGIKIQGDQSKSVSNYIMELDKLAELTGASRKEQEDARKAVMSINELRAAMIEAKESGNTAKAEELQRAYETASTMMAAGMKEEAGAFAKLMAAGGVTDASTARAQQMYGGRGGLIEATKTGRGTEAERYGLAVNQAYEQERRFAGTTKITGPIAGVTGNTAAIADAKLAQQNAEKAAKEAGMSLDEYLKKNREVTDKATKEQVELERKNRAEAIKLETAIMNKNYEAAELMMKAAKKMMGESDVTPVKPAVGSAPGRTNATVSPDIQTAPGQKPGLGSAPGRGIQPKSATPNQSTQALMNAGLILKKGDVQSEGGAVDPRLIEIAKKVQQVVPGFTQFTGFNDQYHHENAPTSKHTQGLAFDFTVAKKPSPEEGKKIVEQLRGLGLDLVIDEYHNPSSKATAGHFHGEIKPPQAFDGGVFSGPKSGYQVELHGKEAIVPLNNPSERMNASDRIEKSALGSSNTPADSAMDMSAMTELFAMMQDKFDEMIDKLDQGNNYADKLVKAMA